MDTPSEIVACLKEHALLRGAPTSEFEWMAAHGEPLSLSAGEVLAVPGEPIDALIILISGHITAHQERPHGRRKIGEWRAGQVSGVLPYSRMGPSLGAAVAEVATDVFQVPQRHMDELVRACPKVTTLMVHEMLDRARDYSALALADEKTMALGKLAAGLAHELNNPAAAITRCAKELVPDLADVDHAVRRLLSQWLEPDQMAAVERVIEACRIPTSEPRSPLDVADREDEILDLLSEHSVEDGIAMTFAESSVSVDDLAALVDLLASGVLEALLALIAGNHAAGRISGSIESAGTRVSEMVTAVKGFTHMDRAITAQSLNIGEGLLQAVRLLTRRAESLSVMVDVEVADGLPSVEGVAPELNQVWHNLIDNALDAVGRSGGQVLARTEHHGRWVVVEVIDDGPGIPDEIAGKIFDPFFTTKRVGEGAGLGLEVVRSVLSRHKGDVDFESRPGLTVFRVSLPVS